MKPGIEELILNGKEPSMTVHTHPNEKNNQGDITVVGVAEPSTGEKQDLENHVVLEDNQLINGPSIILGNKQSIGFDNRVETVRQIGFHDRDGNTQSTNYSRYRKAVNKINKND